MWHHEPGEGSAFSASDRENKFQFTETGKYLAGALHPFFGILLSPVIAATALALSR